MLLRGLKLSGLCMLYEDTGLKLRLIENPPATWPSKAEIFAAGDRAIFDTANAELLYTAKMMVIQTGRSSHIEIAQRSSGEEPTWFDLRIDPDFDDKQQVQGIFTSVRDISETKRRENALRALDREVDHRSLLLLSLISEVLRLTTRGADEIEAVALSCRRRIDSFAQTQNLITQVNWQGIRLRSLAIAQLSKYFPLESDRLHFEGIDPILSPNTALYIGIALHEFSMFSESEQAGAPAIRIVTNVEGPKIELNWLKAFDLRKKTIERSTANAIISDLVTKQLNAETDFEITDGSLIYRLSWIEPALI